MTDRSRLRRGREVFYWPTDAEETANGAGPWPGLIVTVNADGSCDLVVDPPTETDVAAVSAGALAAFTDPPTAVEMGNLRTLVNELRTTVIAARTRANDRLKAGVTQGGNGGQFSLDAGPGSY